MLLARNLEANLAGCCYSLRPRVEPWVLRDWPGHCTHPQRYQHLAVERGTQHRMDRLLTVAQSWHRSRRLQGYTAFVASGMSWWEVEMYARSLGSTLQADTWGWLVACKDRIWMHL